ncbi:uncharacterized protein LOC129872926 [Solanum dulcamara]|uniref:uncharacterized protein LOC129872926 n=1 Tax=Solanum dulcamara TaxID=45834 RepID=UPI002485600F|nr:uncharacterized protein LOC129872926 [Solanum dulcamara]
MIKELFQKRLSAFYENLFFNKQDSWGNSDVVVIHSQKEENPNSLSSQFYLWLVGENLENTTTIFTPSAIYFLCTEKNYSKIRCLCCSATLMRKSPVSVQLKGKNDDGFALIDSTIRKARVICNSKWFTGVCGDDGNRPFVVGYIEGEYPKSKLFWNFMNDLEPRTYKLATVNSGINKMMNTGDKPKFCPEIKELEFLESLSNLCNEEVFPPFLERGNQSALLVKENSNLESKFERIGLSEEGRSHLSSEFDIPSPTTKTNEDVPHQFWYSSLPGEQVNMSRDALRFDDFDQVFKFGASFLDGKEYKSKEISKNGDQVFKFGASKLDGNDCKSKEGNKNGDQLFTFGEGKKDGDHLFNFGEQCKIGEKRGRNRQPQLIMEDNKGTKDVKQVTERLTAFYSSWRKYKEEQWGKADVLVITTPSVATVENLSRSFLVWLLGDEFPEITTVFTDTGIEFLCTKESFFRLRTIGIRMTMVAKVTVSVQLRKRGEQCVDWLKKTLRQVNTSVKSGANWCPLVVGCISGESGEIEVLSHSKMFEVAYVDSSLANLLEQGNFEKPERFAAQQSTLPKQFQMLSLGTCGAKTANAVSFSELAKIRSMDDNSYLSLLSKESCGGAKTLTDDRVDNGGPVEQSKPEENKVIEEDNSSRKLADKMMLLEIKEGDMETSITEDSAEEKLLAEEQNMLLNLENSPLLQVKECGEESRPTAEGGMDYSVQPTGVTDAASEISLPDDNIGSSRKDSVGSDDDWTLIEMECQGQETEVAERVSWRRWFMDKTGKSFGLKDEVSDEAPSKRTKADP